MNATFDPYYKWLGIPPQDQPADHYRLLGLTHFESDPQVIESAADRQMVHLRTFANGPHGSLSQKLLNEVAAARICLLNVPRKTAYDEALRHRLASSAVVMALPRAAYELPDLGIPEISITSAPRRPLPTVRPRPGWRHPAFLSGAATLLIVGVAIAYAASHRSGDVAVSVHKSPVTQRSTALPGVARGFPGPLAPALGQIDPIDDTDSRSPSTTGDHASTGVATDTLPPLGEALAEKMASGQDSQNVVRVAAAPSTGDTNSQGLEPGTRVDLLARIRLPEHAIEGTWKRVADGLSAPASKSRLRLPFHPNGSQYELRIGARRASGSGSLIVGLAYRDREFLVVLDRGGSCYLSYVDGQRQISEATRQRRVLETDRSGEIIITVRDEGLSVVANNESLLDWVDYSRLSPHPDWNEGMGSLLLGWNEAAFIVSKLELTPLSSSSPSAVVAASSLANSAATGTAGLSPSNGQPPAAERRAVPSAAALLAAEKTFRESFSDDLAQAVRPADKVLLARELASKARAATSESADYFVLLREARRLAVEGGEVNLALEMVTTTEQYFESDFWPPRIETLASLSRHVTSPESKQALASSCLQLANQAAAQDEYDHAANLCGLAATAATAMKDTEQSKDAKELQEGYKTRQKQWELASRARDLLKQTPDDAQANLTWGKYVCLVRGKWEEGLPLLAKGADAKLREVAARELARQNASASHVEIGDAWFAIAGASKSDKAERQVYLTRAKEWLERAGNDLSKPELARVEKRVLDITEQLNKLSGGKGRPAFPLTGLVGRVRVDGKDANLVIHYQPTKTFNAQSVKDLLAKHNVKGGAIQIELVGALRLPVDTPSHLFVGGNANAMLNQLYITGAERHLIDGSGRDGRYGVSELLRAGDYYIRWVIAGATLEDCSMGIESTQNNWQPLPVFHTPDMLKSLRPQRAKAEVDVTSE